MEGIVGEAFGSERQAIQLSRISGSYHAELSIRPGGRVTAVHANERDSSREKDLGSECFLCTSLEQRLMDMAILYNPG